MYTEFIIIYLLLLVIIALLIAVLVVTLKSSNSRYGNKTDSNIDFYSTPPIQINNSAEMQSNGAFDKNVKRSAPVEMPATNGGVVFCTKCAHQYSANDKFCPNCGHSRS